MSDPASAGGKRLVVGIVGKAHGIRGEVRVRTFLASPQALGDYGPLGTSDGRVLTVTGVRTLNADMAVARFEGISDRNGAEALSGCELTIARDALPAEAEEDSFYHADLIGLAVRASAGEAIGHIIAIHNFGAGDMLEVKTSGGRQFYPFTRVVVPEVDIAGGYVVLVPPDETGERD